MTSSDGRQPPGKMYVLMKLLPAFSTLVGAVVDRDRLQQHRAVVGAAAREQRRKNVPKYCQPTASIISIETSLS